MSLFGRRSKIGFLFHLFLVLISVRPQLRAGDLDAALESLSHSLSLEPHDPRTIYNVATVLQLKKQFTDAHRYYLQAHALAPQKEKYFIGLANSYYLLQKYHEAIGLYQRYLESHPDSPAVYNNLYYCYHALGDNASALAAIDQAITSEPQHIFLINKVRCAIHMRNFELALRVLDDTIARYGETCETHFQRGVIFQEQNKYAAALRSYDAVLDRDHAHIGALNNSAVLLYALGKKDQAILRWERVLRLDRHNKIAIANITKLKLSDSLQ